MTDHPVITLETAVRVLNEIANESPDRTVSVCQYQDSGQPCCLIGTALHRLGYSVEELAELDTGIDPLEAEQPQDEASDIDVLVRYGRVNATPGAARFMRKAQVAQDGKHTWHDSVLAAEAAI